MEEDLLDIVIKEPSGLYESKTTSRSETYINPFEDWAFKRIFASETSQEMVRAFLNEVLKGKRQIETITYGKNEYPREIKDEGGAVFDFVCTDIDGTTFLVEVQRQEQRFFKERSLFYTSRLISDQAQKGDKGWKYDLKEIYSIGLLEQFCLPDTAVDKYLHDVSLCYTNTGVAFYDKLHFIYIEVKKFAKKSTELVSALDEWIYALKHASKMNDEPHFLKAPGLVHFFHLAKYANLTQEERNMYRTAQQVKWDNQNVLDFQLEKAHERGIEKGALEIAREIANRLKKKGLSAEEIAEVTELTVDKIIAL
ncbi:MAG: Rpn family recombination-promoting nuclease/putative transposase [Flavobacterium sp.]|nr:MAG: Rpn family recombination-promoting nuclease/putative transposase [Flavobacterium sp.]